MSETMRSWARMGLVGAVAVFMLVALVPTVAAGSGAVLTVGHTGTHRHSTGTVVAPCTFTTFRTDVLAGGTVTFGAACTMTMTSAITIGSTLTVNITSGGFSITLSGCSTNQLFLVKGGHLDITNIILESGRTTGTSGLAGTIGSTGTAGSNGAAGTSGTGGTGQAGGSGGAGTVGGAGGNAEGGAIQITSGTVSLVGDSFYSNAAIGGTGGNG